MLYWPGASCNSTFCLFSVSLTTQLHEPWWDVFVVHRSKDSHSLLDLVHILLDSCHKSNVLVILGNNKGILFSFLFLPFSKQEI